MAKSNKEIIVRVGANTAEFNKAMKGLNSNMASMQKSMGNMGRILAGAFSVGAITAFGKASFDAMNEQEKANKKLLAAVGGNVYAYDELSKQAEKLRASTGIDDAVIMQIQQLGIGANLTTEQTKKLTQASVTLAAKTGDDLQTAYEKLYKSLSGNVKGLKGIDIEFGNLTKTQLTNGEAIDLVISKYGNFAEDTVLKTELLKSNFGELQEAIGYAFNEGGFSPALKALNKMVLMATDIVAVWGKFGGSASMFQESKLAESGKAASFNKFKENADEKIKADKKWADKARPLLDERLKSQQALLSTLQKEIEAYVKLNGVPTGDIKTNYENKVLYQQTNVDLIKKEIGYVQELQRIQSGKPGSNSPGTDPAIENKGEISTNQKMFAERLASDLILRKEFSKKSIEIEKQFNETIIQLGDKARELNIEGFQQTGEALQIYLDNYAAAQNEYYSMTTDQYQQEADKFQSMLDQKLISQKQYNDMMALLGAQENQARLSQISSMIGQTASLFNEQTIAFKTLAIAQATINTWAAATAALAPPPLGAGPILGPLFAATAIASGFANVAKISGVELADGGVVPGGYPNDSYPAMLTSGETVVPAKKLPDFQSQHIEVTGVLKAGDIYISNKRGDYLTKRRG